MNSRHWLVLLGGVGTGAAVVLTLVLGVFSTGAEDVADPESVALVSNIVSGTPDGTAEGIKVHGHWIIEVRNPDGSLVSRREFDNALSTTGVTTLNEVLSRSSSVGGWRVIVSGPGGPCLAPSPASCVIAESTDPFFSNKNLTVTVPTTGPNAGKVVLSGNATAQVSGSINQVKTTVQNCSGDTSPAACAGSFVGFSEFTATGTATGLVEQAVQAGQSILVTVALSFS